MGGGEDGVERGGRGGMTWVAVMGEGADQHAECLRAVVHAHAGPTHLKYSLFFHASNIRFMAV